MYCSIAVLLGMRGLVAQWRSNVMILGRIRHFFFERMHHYIIILLHRFITKLFTSSTALLRYHSINAVNSRAIYPII